MIAGRYFITPHAVRQFQARIAPWMSYEEALAVIIKGLKYDAKPPKAMESNAYYIRVKGEWNFRAVVRDGERQPVVITILRSGRGKRAKNRRSQE